MERDQLSSMQFNASDLRPGSYFWRVRATAASGQTSDWTEPLKFIVTSPGFNPSAVRASDLASVHLGGDVYMIRGTTNPGASIRVLDRETTAAGNGAFQIQISAPPAAREVTIQILDSQGNTSQYRLSLTRSS